MPRAGGRRFSDAPAGAKCGVLRLRWGVPDHPRIRSPCTVFFQKGSLLRSRGEGFGAVAPSVVLQKLFFCKLFVGPLKTHVFAIGNSKFTIKHKVLVSQKWRNVVLGRSKLCFSAPGRSPPPRFIKNLMLSSFWAPDPSQTLPLASFPSRPLRNTRFWPSGGTNT